MQTDEAIERVRVGARIRELRLARGLTARTVADELGFSESHILNIEAGRSAATALTRDALAALFGEQVA